MILILGMTTLLWLGPQADFQRAPGRQHLAGCHSGDASACEAVGLPKSLAREVASCYREKDPFKRGDRAQRLSSRIADPELAVAVFRFAPECTSGSAEKIDVVRFSGLARNDPDPDVRRRALAHVDDQSVLTQSATTDPSPDVRAVAVKRLNDAAALAAIARNDSSPLVRGAAVERVSDKALLAEIVSQETDSGVRLGALRNPALIADVALFDQAIHRLPTSIQTQMNLCAGWWVLESGASFHFLPIEPAEGNEVLEFDPNGSVLLRVVTIHFAQGNYSLSDSRTLSVTSMGSTWQFQLEFSPTVMTLSSGSGKATYRRVAPLH